MYILEEVIDGVTHQTRIPDADDWMHNKFIKDNNIKTWRDMIVTIYGEETLETVLEMGKRLSLEGDNKL